MNMFAVVILLACGSESPSESTNDDPSTTPVDSATPASDDSTMTAVDTGPPTDSVRDTATIPPCDPLPPGTLHDQVLMHAGKERIYTLHVPEGLDCHAPVLVDLHGAYGGPDPEKAYVLDEALAAADDLGFVLLRPRGLPLQRYGQQWYYWNVANELAENADFLDALAQTVASDGPRWVMGYSSGADLTGWMLSRHRGWDAYGLVAGASWSTHTWEAFGGDGPPLYTAMGSRDDLASHDTMLAELDDAEHPRDQRFIDTGAGGHRLDRIHYERAIPWFRDGSRPVRAPTSPGWTSTPVSDAPLLAIDPTSVEGSLRLADAVGNIWVDGAAIARGNGPINAVCGDLAAGFGLLRPLPSGGALPIGAIGYAYAHHLACTDGEALAVGADVYTSADGGLSWEVAERGSAAYGEWYGVAVTAETAAAVGQYNRIAVRRVDGAETSWHDTVITPFQERWLYGVAIDPVADPATGQQTVWAVGEDGWVGRSLDDDRFVEVTRLGDLPLYAVAAHDGRVAVAGHDGGVWVSDDGETFSAYPIDTGAVTALSFADGELLATGSDGAVWRRPL